MKTDDLIRVLAQQQSADALPSAHVWRRALWAVLAAFAVSALLLIFVIDLNPDLIADASSVVMFWGKLAFGGMIAFAMALTFPRVASPGTHRPSRHWIALIALGTMTGLAIAQFFALTGSERVETLLQDSWVHCLVSIAVLSIPLFIAALWALRQFAPTNLRVAGAVAGAFAGGVAAFLYALHCATYDAIYVAVWYTLGIAIPSALGALLGPKLLRW